MAIISSLTYLMSISDGYFLPSGEPTPFFSLCYKKNALMLKCAIFVTVNKLIGAVFLLGKYFSDYLLNYPPIIVSIKEEKLMKLTNAYIKKHTALKKSVRLIRKSLPKIQVFIQYVFPHTITDC